MVPIKTFVIGPTSGSKQEYFSASLLYCQQIRINISHPSPPPAEVHSEISNSIHPHSLTCLNQGSSKSQVTYWFRKNFLLYSRVKQFRRAPEQFGFEKLFQGLPLAPTLWSSSSQSYYVLFTYKDFSLIESQFGYATAEAARIFVSGETSCKTCRK